MATLKRLQSFLKKKYKSHSQENDPLLPADSSYGSPEEIKEFDNNYTTDTRNLQPKELVELQKQLADIPNVQPKETLRAYITKLYHYLNTDECFVSGAFVIADDSNALYKLLFKCKTLNLTALHLESHTAFKMGKHKKNKDQPIYENWMLGNLTYMMKCNCVSGNATRPARNVKWYQFTGIDNLKYIYMKLEDWPTLHPMHLGQAVLRYVLSKPNESCVQPRREDCKRAEGESHRESHRESKPLISLESAEDCHIDRDKNKTDYGRVGDEYFVNQDLNTKILSTINSPTSAGGRKSRKHKRKTLKSTHTRRVRRHRSNMRKKLKKYSRQK